MVALTLLIIKSSSDPMRSLNVQGRVWAYSHRPELACLNYVEGC